MGNGESKTLDEQISEMLGQRPAEEEEVVDELPEEEGQPAEEVAEEEPSGEAPTGEEIEEVTGEEVPAEPEEEVAEEGEAEDEEEETAEEGAGEPEEVEEVSDDLADFRKKVNLMAEASLRSGIPLPPDLLGIEEGEEGTPAETPPAQPSREQPPVQMPQVTADSDAFEILKGDVDFDEFLDTREGFEEGMKDVFARHEQIVTQKVLSSIPAVVNNQVRQAVALQSAVNEFYEVNSDLKPVRSTVGAVAEQVANKHPDWPVEKIFSESAAVTRKLLKMPSQGVRNRTRPANPSFAKKTRTSQRKKPVIQRSKLQSEIDDLIN